ncbi:primosomal protein N' [bacterium]|nr:primosomal protein N' [bacterium]
MSKIAKVVVPRADLPPFYYAVPDAISISIGTVVEVEVRNSLIWALVIELLDELPDSASFTLKPIRGPIFSTPLIPNTPFFTFLQWLSEYYIYSIPKLIKQVITPYLKPNRTLRGVMPAAVSFALPHQDRAVQPTEEQARVIAAIAARWKKKEYTPTLLYGITGSGKTEVYLQLAKSIIEDGGQVLYLVPEIGLIEPTAQSIEKRLGISVARLHSFLKPKARFLSAAGVMQGNFALVVGTRSALLYPQKNLRLIIVDEEHDSSYKNMEPPYYHGRDSAIMLAHLLKIPLLLGSATPSSESWYNATQAGKYHLEQLLKRYGKGALPTIKTFPYKGDIYLPSNIVVKAAEELEQDNNILFFLNRRGYATLAICDDCKAVQECAVCKTAMIYHRKKGVLLCHHCGRSLPLAHCSECNSTHLRLDGIGIEKLYEALSHYFPEKEIISVDRDSIPNEKMLAEAMEKIHTGSGNIILGTIMISKGHNFPDLHLSIIKFADYMLNFRDYRAAERCYQVVMQVAGRVGRTGGNGEVWAEAMQPTHYIWEHIKNGDYAGFMDEELEWREQLFLPPFSRMALLKVSGADDDKVEEIAGKLYQTLSAYQSETLRVQPPVKPPLYRVMGKFRRVIALSSPKAKELRIAIKTTLNTTFIPRSVLCTIDIDAINQA